mmetsp:Transcript_3596/g.5289  ORF Transcript_3596/g.5289 Transcript_3596/m.5289 type:complete len:970 (+) Transcript_3596:254-3163(+)
MKATEDLERKTNTATDQANEIASLNRELRSLRKDHEHLQKKYDETITEHVQLKQKAEEQEEKLKNQSQDIQKLDLELRTTKVELSDVTEELASKVKTNSMEQEQYEKKMGNLKDQLTTRENDLFKANSEINELKHNITLAKHSRDRLQTQYESLQSELEKVTMDKADALESARKTKQKLSQVEDKASDLTHKLQNETAERQTLESRLVEEKEHREKDGKAKGELEREMAATKASYSKIIDNLKEDLRELRSEVAKLSSNLNRAETTIGTLNDEKGDLEYEKRLLTDSLTTTREAHGREKETLKNDLFAAKNTIEKLERVLAELKESSEATIDKLHEDISNSQNDHETMTTSHKKIIESLQSKFEAAEQEKKTLEHRIQTNREAHAEILDEVRKENNALNETILRLTNDVDKLTNSNKQASQDLHAKKRAYDNLMQDYNVLEDAMNKEQQTRKKDKEDYGQTLEKLKDANDRSLKKLASEKSEEMTAKNELEKTLRDTQSSLRLTKEELESMKQDYENSMEIIKDLRQHQSKTLLDHEKQVDTLSTQLKELQHEHQSVTDVLNEKEQFLETTSSNLATTDQRLSNLMEEHDRMLKSKDKEIAAYSKSLETLQQQLATDHERYNRQAHKLRETENQLDNSREMREREGKDSEEKYEHLLQTMSSIVAAKESLENSLEESAKQVGALRDQLKNQKRNHESMMKNLKDMQATDEKAVEAELNDLRSIVASLSQSKRELMDNLLAKEKELVQSQHIINRGRIDLHETFTFEKNASSLQETHSNRTLLDYLSSIIKRHQLSIRVEGHTGKGMKPLSYYQELSEQRARTICRELQMRGIESKFLSAKGWGYSKPNVQGGDNKRVEILVMKPGDKKVIQLEDDNIRLKEIVKDMAQQLRNFTGSSPQIRSSLYHSFSSPTPNSPVSPMIPLTTSPTATSYSRRTMVSNNTSSEPVVSPTTNRAGSTHQPEGSTNESS